MAATAHLAALAAQLGRGWADAAIMLTQGLIEGGHDLNAEEVSQQRLALAIPRQGTS